MKKNLTNKKIFLILTVLSALMAVPQVSLAFTFKSLASFFIFTIVNPLVISIIGLAVVYFLWGVAKYILHSGDAKAREEGRNMMIYGIIAIFVMVSMYGLVNLLKTTFELNKTTLPNVGNFLS